MDHVSETAIRPKTATLGNSDGIHADSHHAIILLDTHHPLFFLLRNRQRHVIADAAIQTTQHVSLHRLMVYY